jgi:hypothetical protein
MYDGFFEDLITLVGLGVSFYLLGSSLFRLSRIRVKERTLILWDDLTRWYLRLKTTRQIPEELVICFDTRLNDDETTPVFLINVYYSNVPVFNFEEPLNSFLAIKRVKKKVMNIDFKKLTTQAYNVYMEGVINDLDGIRPD